MSLVRKTEPQYHIDELELDGLIKLLRERADVAHDEGDANAEKFEGAYLAFLTVRRGSFKYPRDFLAVFELELN